MSIESDLAAVKQNGLALRYVKKQTPEICLAAVKQEGWSLQHVKRQNPEICLAAIKQRWWALRYVKKQTLELCLTAASVNILSTRFINIYHKELIPYVLDGFREEFIINEVGKELTIGCTTKTINQWKRIRSNNKLLSDYPAAKVYLKELKEGILGELKC